MLSGLAVGSVGEVSGGGGPRSGGRVDLQPTACAAALSMGDYHNVGRRGHGCALCLVSKQESGVR